MSRVAGEALARRRCALGGIRPVLALPGRQALLCGCSLLLGGRAGWCEGGAFSYPVLLLAGSRPTAGDFHIWEMLDQHELMASSAGLPSPLEAHPTLRAFHARLRALPQLQLYFDSEAAHLPCNNRMAHFR